MSASARALYRVRRTWADKDSQVGAFADLDKAKAACPVGYSVYDSAGNAVYTNRKDELEMQISKEDLQKMINDAATKAAKEAVMADCGQALQASGRCVGAQLPAPMLDKLAAKGYLKGRSGTGADMVIDMYESDIRAQVIAGQRPEAAGLLD